jgi:hypothetical protein
MMSTASLILGKHERDPLVRFVPEMVEVFSQHLISPLPHSLDGQLDFDI